MTALLFYKMNGHELKIVNTKHILVVYILNKPIFDCAIDIVIRPLGIYNIQNHNESICYAVKYPLLSSRNEPEIHQAMHVELVK